MDLADMFSIASSDPNARTDALFDPTSTKVVVSLLLAATAA